MKQAEDYLGAARARLRQINERIAEIELQLKSKTIQGGMRARAILDELRQKRTGIEKRIQAARGEGAEYWERVQGDLEELWKDLGRGFSAVGTTLATKQDPKEDD